MFTGLVSDLGRVLSLDGSPEGVRFAVATRLASELAPGDSVAVNGVCLTATAVSQDSFTAEVMNQTVALTSLARLQLGSTVNLELPLRPGDRLGGHVVQGHVDGVGTVVDVRDDGFARRVSVRASAEVLRYVVEKGSIALDGVSLTVAELDSGSFTVSLIPETLDRTTFGGVRTGATVNLEVDVLAKYVEKLMQR